MADQISFKERKIESYIKNHLKNKKVIFNYNSLKANTYTPKCMSITPLSQLYFYDEFIEKRLNGSLYFVIGKIGNNMFFLDIKTLFPLLDFSFTDCYFQEESTDLWPFVCVKINGKWGVFDVETQQLCIPPLYDNIEFIHKTYDVFVVILDGRYGLCSRYGNLVIDAIFDNIKIIGKNTLIIEKEGYKVFFDIKEERIIKNCEQLYDKNRLMSTKTKNQILYVEKILYVPTIEEIIQHEKDYYKGVATGKKAYDMLAKPFVADSSKLKWIVEKERLRRINIPFPTNGLLMEGDVIYIANDINNLFASDCWDPSEGGVFALRKRGDSIGGINFRFLQLYWIRHEFAEINGEFVKTGKTVTPRTFFEHELYDIVSSFKTGQEIWDYIRGKTLRVIDIISFWTGANFYNGVYNGIRMVNSPVFEIINEDADEKYGLIHNCYRIISNENGKYGISEKNTKDVMVSCSFDKIKWGKDLVYYYRNQKVAIMRISDLDKFINR